MLQSIDIKKALSLLTKPEHPVLLISGQKKEKINIMPAGGVTRTSHKPPLMAVSVGFTRFTHKLMTKYEYFILSYPVKKHIKMIKYTGNCSGKHVDRFSSININTVPAQKVDLPVLKEDKVNFECQKKAQVKTGDHTLFVGRVVAATGNQSANAVINVGNYTYKEFYNNE